MHEMDPDLSRWGLHLLIEPPLNSSYSFLLNQVVDMEHAKDSSIRKNCSSFENDEVIAHVLQEELSQVALAEASGHSYGAAEEQLHASVLAQNWIDLSAHDSYLGSEPTQNVSKDMEACTSFSIPGDNLHNNEMCSLHLANEFSTLDAEVYRRLNNLTSVPHVPKINGVIPSDDEATSDHQRLLDRLKVYGLAELKVQGDGNCQFRAISDQFYRTFEHHKFVRQQIVDQLKSHPTIYEGYVPMAYDDYIRKMSKSGEWGDHVTLQAAADSYGVKIFIMTSFKDTCYIEILPNVQKSERVIFLSFWAEVHYNSIYPEEELPISEAKKKRRWWHWIIRDV